MNYITFGNDEYTLCFNSENGYLEKVEYLGKPIELGSKLWSVCTANGELGIDNMKSFCAKAYEDVLKLFWKNEKALVTVNLKNDENKKIRMNLSVDLYDEDAINDVRFPIIGTFPRSPSLNSSEELRGPHACRPFWAFLQLFLP